MDEDTIAILLEIQNFAKAYKQVQQMARAVKDLDSPLKQHRNSVNAVNAAWRNVANTVKSVRSTLPRNPGGGGAGGAGNIFNNMRINSLNIHATVVHVQGGSGGSGGGGRLPGSPALGRFSPAQRLQHQMGVLRGAVASGDPNRIFDAQYGAHMIHQRVQLAKNYMSPMAIQARNISNALAPIRALSTAIGEVTGPLVAFGGGVVAAGIALYELVKRTAEAGTEFMKLGFTAGGTQAETAQLSVLGGALGVDMGQMARAFADEISKGGPAAGFAERAQIHHSGIFDTTDVATNLLNWLKQIRALTDDEAKRAARVTHTEALLPLRNMSKQSEDMLQMTSMVRGSVFDQKFQKDSLDFMLALGNIGESFQNFMAAVIKPFLPEITQFLNEVAAGFNTLAAMINDNQAIFKAWIEIMAGIASMNLLDTMKGFKDMQDAMKPGATGGIEAHTRAMERHTDALDSWSQRNGTYGGGERARGAVPPHWTDWSGLNTRSYVQQARQLGAFAL